MNLKCDVLVSKFAFKWVILCRYAEAVEVAVRTKLALEKAALEAEYAAREAQLLEKIAVLEQQMGTA